MGHNIFGGLLYAILMSSIIGIVWGKYSYEPALRGWIAQYKTISTFDEAVERCWSDGAVLMSPLRKELLDKMRSLIGNTRYYIGVQTRFHPALFESIEGVLLDDMPVADMYEQLDPQEGQCLSMSCDRVSIVPCSSRLPYMCYKEETSDLLVTECGTFDKGYQLNSNKSHCYKFHMELKPWREAYFTCTAEDAYLAIVDDEKEAQELVKVAFDKTYYVHVGVLDWQGKGVWKSIQGTPIQEIFHTWENNTHSANKTFAAMNAYSGELRAFLENEKAYFICEKDPKKFKFSCNSWY